jgi:Plasmid stabilization system protein
MGYNLKITHRAEQDIDAILTYIMIDLQNTEAALHLADEVEKRYNLLIENPYLYEECQQPLLRQMHYRKIVIGSYLLIYRINKDTDTVYIERFFSEMQNYASKL